MATIQEQNKYLSFDDPRLDNAQYIMLLIDKQHNLNNTADDVSRRALGFLEGNGVLLGQHVCESGTYDLYISGFPSCTNHAGVKIDKANALATYLKSGRMDELYFSSSSYIRPVLKDNPEQYLGVYFSVAETIHYLDGLKKVEVAV